ncbi:hypothetical protein V6Z11_A01G077400 [Gossypium hirsutum]
MPTKLKSDSSSCSATHALEIDLPFCNLGQFFFQCPFSRQKAHSSLAGLPLDLPLLPGLFIVEVQGSTCNVPIQLGTKIAIIPCQLLTQLANQFYFLLSVPTLFDFSNNGWVPIVSELIEYRNRTWKSKLIHTTFSEEVAQQILLIPLARSPHDDFLCWRGKASDEYKARSGYKILLQSNGNYNQSANNNFYKKIWTSDLPLKIRITAWRSTLNYLPTLANLKTKRVTNNDICQRCMQGQENRDHLFRDCAVSKETWAELEFAWPQNILQSEYMEWFTGTVLNSKTEVVQIFICAIWAIWSARNKWVHESQKRSGAETANFI